MPEPRTIRAGIVLGESPRWHDGRIWYADWGTQEVVAVDAEGEAETVARVGALPICFGWLPDGRMLVVSGADGVLLRRELDGSLVPHADLTALADPPWNDIVVDGRGNAYVGNTGFAFPAEEFAPGRVALVHPDGSARIVAEDLALPNGMAVTPDNGTLVVAESYGRRLTAFSIDARGDLSRRRVWADLGDGVPDGICLDGEGAAWYGDVPNRRCVRVREGGEVLSTLELDRGCFACTLGGEDGCTLFMVAAHWRGTTSTTGEPPSGRLLATAAPAPGAGWP